MECPKCSGPGKQLYRVPPAQQGGVVPISVACYFCYLRLTGRKPTASKLEPGTEAGSRS
jgi:hypothetical protein